MTGNGTGVLAPDVSAGTAGEGSASPILARAVAGGKAAARNRKLHIGHFAFMRSVLQGLDTRESWDRYLRIEGEHNDIRHVNRTIAWIRDEFAAAAQRHARHGIARLVRIDARRIQEQAPQLPTLEEFAHEHGLHDFAQHEQIEHYQARFGTALPRRSRRQRLIAKQLEALDWLERLVVQPPRSGDAVASWLNPDLAGHLERAGIFTIGQLIDRINGLGMRWWSGVRAIGAAKAERIMEWLAAHETSINLSIGAHVKVKRSHLNAHDLDRVVPCATAIVPIEKLIVPAELDGTDGLYRVPQRQCLIEAKTDSEAVLTWIKAKPGLSEQQKIAMQRKRGIDPSVPEGPMEWLRYLSNTQRAYLKEAERFMLWAVVQHNKPLSSMTREDCEAYLAFLASPTPAARWCGPRGRERWGPLWRPFEGPLSPRAQQHAVAILKSLYNFLAAQCYLTGNPWNGISMPKATAPRINGARSFTQAEWQFIQGQLALLPTTSANRRLVFALPLLYSTGLRLAEAVAARVDDLCRVTYPGGRNREPVEYCELKVIGRGGKERRMLVPLDVTVELSKYLISRGLHPDPSHATNRGAYLLGKTVDIAERAPWSRRTVLQVDPKEGILAGRLYKVLKAFFADCANVLATTDAKGVARLAAASTHWLRHTYGARSTTADIALDVLQ
jgi:site-specific recombinase XerD